MKRFNLTYTLLFCLSFAFGQSTTITGNVYDALTNTPLSNYTVTSNGGGGSTTTNASGAYTLVVPTTNDFHVIVAAQNGKCYRQKWTWGRKIIDFHLTACNFDRSRDSIALRSLYDNLNGAAWTSPWNIAQPITTWGLVYSSNGGGPIEFVGLDNRNLNGTFPTSATGFSNLRDLFGFDFSNNANLRGALPSLSNMKQLDWVKLQNTGMSGDPLSSITGLKNIEMLSLRNNTSMSASFPSTLSTDWRNIYKLQLEGINVSGTIPTALFALPNVQTVGLGQNKLTGTVPALPSGNSSTIQYLVLNDNDLDSLPNLSVSTTLTALGVKGNRLTFDDIIPNISKFNAATIYEGSANTFVYAPQDSFFVDTTIRASENTPLSIDVKIDGALTNNKYKWYKNGVFFRSTTFNKLAFTNLALADAGTYTCDVVNPLAPLLTLQSRSITLNVATACRYRDSLALVDLYNATNGANWTNRWILTQPMMTWSGVTFSAQGCIEKVDLFNRGLVGSINTSIGNMLDLKELTLSTNTLSGSLPTEIGNLTKLEVLSLHNNQLSGSLPNIFSALTTLKTLRLHFNTLSGTIPNSLSSLTNLQELALGANGFSGTIPTSLGNLVNLTYLDLGKNYTLTGTIPTSFANLVNLQTVYLNNNQLTGSLPLGFANTAAMQSLFLTKNALDSLPFLGNIPITSQVWIDSNRLTFDDILPNRGRFRVYQYGTQDSFFVDTTITATVGLPLSIDLKIDGALTTNQYRWFKDGAFSRTFLTNKLFFNTLQASDAGVWTCQVTNSAAPLLTLYSRKITIQVTNTSCRTRDSLALVDLYNTTGGTTWTRRDNWLSATMPINTWYGVTLNTEGCLDTLKLQSNNLIGALPSAIGDWTNLKTLNVSINKISSIPNSIGRLDSVTSLILATNQLAGAIPDSIGGMQQLLDLQLQENLLTGPLPTTFGGLAATEFRLDISQNQLSGDAATIFPHASLPVNLNKLIAINTRLTGTIPAYFAKPNMLILKLDDNTLTGAMPESFKTLTFGSEVYYGITLSNNRIDSLPQFTQYNPNSEVWIQKNKLTFDDILPLASPTNVVNCQNQDSVFQQTTLQGTLGTPLSIDLKIDGALTTNRYQWFKNGTSFGNALTINKLTFNNLTTNDTAVYTCTITNPQAPRCSLFCRPITVKVGCGAGNSQTLTPSVCTAYTSPSGKIFNTSGTYRDTLKTTNSCDSIVYTINLTITPSATSQVLTPSVCTVYTSPSGKILNTSGTYRDTLKTTIGCDSILYTINLTIQNTATSQTLTPSVCTAFTSPSGKIFNTSGAYRDTVRTTNGCDSIRYTINLTVQNTAINQILTALRCLTYMSPSGKVFTISGVYKDTLKTVNGCDSIRYTINLTLGLTLTSQILTPSVCTAYSSPSGKVFTTSGIYQDTVRTINGCDSIRYTIILTIQNTATSQILNPSICPNQTYRSPSGKTFSTAGTKLDTLKNINGCDSIHLIINLTIQTPQYQQIATQFICRGDVFGNIVLTRDTLLKDTLRSIALCDSVITTTLIKVNLPSVNNLNLSLCVGTSATVNGVVYNAANRSGQQILRAASAEGCDSIINITTSFVANMRAIEDEYTISDSTNTLNFNVLDNDFVSGNTKVTPLSKPIVGQLDTLGGGRFRYVFPPQTNGTATFNYSVCSTVCPSLCDTAVVKININRPRLAGDVSFGITPHCVCPNDRLIFSELELDPDKYPANELVIISRWGDVVYRAKPYHNDWTGTNEKGENLPAGTYYYIMRLAIADGKIKTGDVTIYR